MIEYCPALMLSVGRDSQPCHQQKMDHPLALPSQFCPNLMDPAANLPEKAVCACTLDLVIFVFFQAQRGNFFS